MFGNILGAMQSRYAPAGQNSTGMNTGASGAAGSLSGFYGTGAGGGMGNIGQLIGQLIGQAPAAQPQPQPQPQMPQQPTQSPQHSQLRALLQMHPQIMGLLQAIMARQGGQQRRTIGSPIQMPQANSASPQTAMTAMRSSMAGY
jgi:hypothetical protein